LRRGPALALRAGMRRLAAIGFVWFCCSLAWVVLGKTLLERSDVATGGLGAKVEGNWGPVQVQDPPRASWLERTLVYEREQRWDEAKNQSVMTNVEKVQLVPHPIPLDRSDVAARLHLEHRQKGLLWFPTYEVAFRGTYLFRNDSGAPREVRFELPLGRDGGTEFDDFAIADAAGKPIEVAFEGGAATFTRPLAVGETLAYEVAYRTRGTYRWAYGRPGQGLGPEAGRARAFRLVLETDFAEVDFPDGALSPSRHGRVGGGWRGEWTFEQLVGTKPIALELPQRLNPGPLAAAITMFAPVSLLFFFFVVGILLAARRRSIHPLNYFLLGCAFFGFHLLFAYLIDHLAIAPAFALSAAVSIALVVSYARLFVGLRTAVVQFGLAQLVYLVLFSFTFFWEGFTGLAITIGAIGTLFVIMQITGRLDWETVFAPPQAAQPPTP
jgi:hypothetical protein